MDGEVFDDDDELWGWDMSWDDDQNGRVVSCWREPQVMWTVTLMHCHASDDDRVEFEEERKVRMM